MGRLDGRTAIITGGGGGIGTATARLFSQEGARVAIVDCNSETTEAARAEIRAAVARAEPLGIVVDLAREEAAAEVITRTVAAFGNVDILVNNVGIRAYEPLAEARSETWRDILAVNLLSYAYLAREALPHLRASGHGSIVNVSSTHAFNPRAGMGQYDVTKAGIVSMTRTLAFEEAAHGVRVNAVCPGATLTPFHTRRAAALRRTRQDLEGEAAATCLMRRWAEPREIAFPILWLASDEASYITGTALTADGGRLVI